MLIFMSYNQSPMHLERSTESGLFSVLFISFLQQGQQTFSVKGHVVNIFDFIGWVVFVAAA